MLRMVRSALRTADRFVQQVPSSGIRLKTLGNILSHVRGPAQSASAHTSTFSHSASTFRNASSHQAPPSFSFPVRVAMNRAPLSPPRLPRAPGVPRSVTQVGLGTARNFSSSRQLFQNFVENVPITTRALWEAEWDMKMQQKKQRKMLKKQKENKQKARVADKVKPVQSKLSTVSICTTGDETEKAALSPIEDSFSEYFAPSPVAVDRVAGVTTFLTIPLYPANDRTPLPGESDRLFNLSEIQQIQDTFSVHRAKVTSLFRRLDTADVWSKGARCTQYGYGPMMTTLQVSFEGWTKEMVLGTIGEAGKNWCQLIEERERDPPAMGFVVPTLELPSSSFAPLDDLGAHRPSEVHDDGWSSASSRPLSPGSEAWTASSLNDGHLPETIQVDNLSTGMTLGFSYDFMSRGSSAQEHDDRFTAF